ncbi:HUWE1-associated protein modifying stress responses-like [Lineus longissimus]|uniref:HUWE1-associated protein modifying stress responses-like n=1 Tax=Lineus longissimus TaxID=88925 RepID=UPI002B4F358A
MSEEREREQDRLADSWLKSWEDQCVSEFENQPNMEDRAQLDREESSQKLWLLFQNSASSVAQLYKDRHNQFDEGISLWVPFQNAAGSVTHLYRDSTDCMRRAFEIGIQCGHQRRTKDLLQWAKKRRRHIRREDLIAYLCGKNPPRHRPSATLSKPPSRTNLDRSSPMRPPSGHLHVEQGEEPDLQPFREALALQGLNGAMSNISVRTGSHGNVQDLVRNERDSDLDCFIMNEFSRNCERKRPSSPTDVIMDSPTRKRSRLF